MVGDPSGRNKLRPQLSARRGRAQPETYVAQVGRVLDMPRTEVHRNSEWFDPMRFEDVLRLAGRMTVARMLERDTFEKRVAANELIGIHEFLYPLMQGWDSVMIRADVELGGTDQLFNLLVGRDLQQQSEQAPQICLTLPLINGLDGRKMSKSYGNAIALTESAESMFGKVMSIGDEAMAAWFTLLTSVEPMSARVRRSPARGKAPGRGDRWFFPRPRGRARGARRLRPPIPRQEVPAEVAHLGDGRRACRWRSCCATKLAPISPMRRQRQDSHDSPQTTSASFPSRTR